MLNKMYIWKNIRGVYSLITFGGFLLTSCNVKILCVRQNLCKLIFIQGRIIFLKRTGSFSNKNVFLIFEAAYVFDMLYVMYEIIVAQDCAVIIILV